MGCKGCVTVIHHEREKVSATSLLIESFSPTINISHPVQTMSASCLTPFNRCSSSWFAIAPFNLFPEHDALLQRRRSVSGLLNDSAISAKMHPISDPSAVVRGIIFSSRYKIAVIGIMHGLSHGLLVYQS